MLACFKAVLRASVKAKVSLVTFGSHSMQQPPINSLASGGVLLVSSMLPFLWQSTCQRAVDVNIDLCLSCLPVRPMHQRLVGAKSPERALAALQSFRPARPVQHHLHLCPQGCLALQIPKSCHACNLCDASHVTFVKKLVCCAKCCRAGTHRVHGVQNLLRDQHRSASRGPSAHSPSANGHCGRQWGICGRLEAWLHACTAPRACRDPHSPACWPQASPHHRHLGRYKGVVPSQSALYQHTDRNSFLLTNQWWHNGLTLLQFSLVQYADWKESTHDRSIQTGRWSMTCDVHTGTGSVAC